MLLSNNIPVQSTRLIILSLILCTSITEAQTQPAEADAGMQGQDPADSRRIERLGEVTAQDWEMDLTLPAAAPEVTPNSNTPRLPDPQQDQKLHELLSSLAASPGNANVLAELNSLLADILDQANSMMDTGLYRQAGQLLQLLQSIDPNLAGLDAAKSRLEPSSGVIELIEAGYAALESQQIIEPENDNALDYFKRALDKAPNSEIALAGLSAVQEKMLGLALESARELDFEAAESWLYEASLIQGQQAQFEQTDTKIELARQAYAIELEQKAIDAMDTGNYKLADVSIIELIALGGQQARVDALRARLQDVRLYGGFEPGQVFSDELLQTGGSAPQLVIIPAGSFQMGSRRYTEHEEPRHRVTLSKGFGLGVREVTVGEFGLFAERTAYRSTAERNGSSSVYNETAGRLNTRDEINWTHDYRGNKARPEMPVLHVSFRDARAYVQWLARETGRAYRLPSEAEYEYVARAGGKGTYWWGEGPPPEAVENLTGERDRSPGKREWSTFFNRYGDGHWGPAPAGSLVSDALAHPMGVHDIAGNVSEWTEDCWHENYVQAPADGTAWVNPGCKRRVVRGGYWASSPERSRATLRIPVSELKYGPVIGFRVARDL